MTEFSANRVGSHEAGALGMSGSGGVTERANIFWGLGTNVLGGLALEAPNHGGNGGFRVEDGDGVVACSGLHNHLQSSWEHNMSSAHSRSVSSVNPSPASLSWHRVVMILFPCGKGGGSGVMREGVGSSGHLGRRIDSGICGGQGFGGRGGSGRTGRAWVSSGIGGWTSVLLLNLHCSLHWVIGPIIHLPLLLQE